MAYFMFPVILYWFSIRKQDEKLFELLPCLKLSSLEQVNIVYVVLLHEGLEELTH